MGTKRTTLFMACMAICWGAMLCCPLAAEQMCKWVDQHGTVHYAENCPETTAGESVQIDQGPSLEVIKAAEQRAAEQSALKAERQRARFEAEETKAGNEQAAAVSGLQKDLCRHALRDSAILKQQLPVYADSSGVYHLRGSLHFWYYKGKHTWLEDDQRQTELDRYMQIIEKQCVDVTRADLPYLRTFRNPPGTNEIVRYFEFYDPEIWPQFYREEAADWCAYGKSYLTQDEISPSRDADIPLLRDLLEAKCR